MHRSGAPVPGQDQFTGFGNLLHQGQHAVLRDRHVILVTPRLLSPRGRTGKLCTRRAAARHYCCEDILPTTEGPWRLVR